MLPSNGLVASQITLSKPFVLTLSIIVIVSFADLLVHRAFISLFCAVRTACNWLRQNKTFSYRAVTLGVKHFLNGANDGLPVRRDIDWYSGKTSVPSKLAVAVTVSPMMTVTTLNRVRCNGQLRYRLRHTAQWSLVGKLCLITDH